MKALTLLVGIGTGVLALAADVRTSDYPTISAAVAACAEKGGGRVVVPTGVYELNGGLIVPDTTGRVSVVRLVGWVLREVAINGAGEGEI